MPVLSWNRYGKSRVRLVKIRRPSGRARGAQDPHEIVDFTIDVSLEGDSDAVYVDGDNRSCLATDTMKNTVYALARGGFVIPALKPLYGYAWFVGFFAADPDVRAGDAESMRDEQVTYEDIQDRHLVRCGRRGRRAAGGRRDVAD